MPIYTYTKIFEDLYIYIYIHIYIYTLYNSSMQVKPEYSI